jgi:hypothetical protein
LRARKNPVGVLEGALPTDHRDPGAKKALINRNPVVLSYPYPKKKVSRIRLTLRY